MYNRTLRQIDMGNIDFGTIKFQYHPLDMVKSETVMNAKINK